MAYWGNVDYLRVFVLFSKGVKSMKFTTRLAKVDWGKIGKNILIFSAPALAVFFGQLASGVEPKKAVWVAILIIYGILADFFKKLKA